jgi:ABC-type amino acid transport substrate-binding protein
MSTSLVALALAGLVAGASSGDAVLRVGTSTRNPPWVYVSGHDFTKEDFSKSPRLAPEQIEMLVGIDVEVANAVAKRLGTRVQWVPTLWADLEAGLLAHHFDVIIGSWTPSEKTPEAIVATEPYLHWGLLMAVHSDDRTIASYADLEGKRVGHIQDPAVEKGLRAVGRGRFIAMEGELPLIEAFRVRVLDAVILDSVFIRWLAAHDPSLRIVGEPLNRLGYHVGVRRGDAALMDRTRAAVKELLDSGEAERIRRRWEGRDSPIPPPLGPIP